LCSTRVLTISCAAVVLCAVMVAVCSAAHKSKFSRRRAFNEDADVNYINERNRVFNKKLNRFYDKYTADLKNTIERGTAL
jgi:hypothetical protein